MPAICPPERPLAARTPGLGAPAAVADGCAEVVPVGLPVEAGAVPLELVAGGVVASGVDEGLSDVAAGADVGEVSEEGVAPAVADAVLSVAVGEAGGADSAVRVP